MRAALVPTVSLDVSVVISHMTTPRSLAPPRQERAAMLMGREPEHMVRAHFASPKERVYAIKMLTNIA
jgi:hypothetical protein